MHPPATRRRVLVVDDEPGVLEALSLALEGSYHVRVLDDGAAALALLSAFRPDLVILDLAMRGLDGVQTLERIRRADPALPVIVVTGRSTKERAELAADLGVSGYLTKPFDLDRLLGRVAAILRPRDPAAAPPGTVAHPLVRRALAHAQPRLGEKLTLRDLAAAVDATPFHLCRVFRRELGLTPMAYLTRLRIERAKVLLRDGFRPTSALAAQLGFAYPHHFSRVFKAVTGLTPARFRDLASEGAPEPGRAPPRPPAGSHRRG